MTLKKSTLSPAMRLDMGAAILLAAETHAVPSIKRRLAAFAASQRRYAQAQRAVDAADEQWRAAQARLAARDAAQDAAVEALARALVTTGHARHNPFASFAAETPSALKEMPPAEAAKAIHSLVAAVRRQHAVGAPILEAAQTAVKAARAVEAAAASFAQLQERSRLARQRRDGIGATWDTALATLKRATRAADDSAPGLYAAFFGRFVRPTRKRQPAASPPDTPSPSAPQLAAEATQ